MALTYTQLTGTKDTEGSIRNWVNRADIPATTILNEAEALIYEHLRSREMMTDAVFQFDIATSSEALPADFLDGLQFLPYEWGEPLLFVHEQLARVPRDADGAVLEGTPSAWYILGETAYVNAKCVDNFAGRLMYYAQPAELSSGNPTNFLTRRYPALVRFACMQRAFEHMKDTNRATEYLKLMIGSAGSASVSNELFRRSQHVPAF